MSHIYPKVIDDYHNSWGEKEILLALKNLSDEWHIFYSVNWNSRNRYGNIVWGEADFVILHEKYGILVIEVKSGGISLKDGVWTQTRLDNNQQISMKNPFVQANRSKYKLIDILDNSLPNNQRCQVEKAVWFPSIEDLSGIDLPLEYSYDTILTKDALGFTEEYLIRAYKYYNSSNNTNLDKNGIETIRKLLMPEFDLIPSQSTDVEEETFSLIRTTEEQKKVLDLIDLQGDVAISGGAGTGKTVLAVEEARRLAEGGRKVLFLCFNRFLYDSLSRNNPHFNIEYSTLYTFFNSYTNIRNEENDYSLLLQAIRETDFFDLDYDTLVIDEAQDFEGKALDIIIKNAKKADVKVLVFYDKNQILYANRKDIEATINDFDCKITLSVNCRNTKKIISTANSPLGIVTKHINNEINGVMPRFISRNNKEAILVKLREVIASYIAEGFSPNDIVILTLKTEQTSVMEGINTIDNYVVSNNPNDQSKQQTIVFTTARKFKGLESKIVLLVDFNKENITDEIGKNLFYVAASRAKNRLDILTVLTEEEIAEIAREINYREYPELAIIKKLKVKPDIEK